MSTSPTSSDGEQLRFAGMPVESTLFSLKSGSNLYTDRQLPYQSNVTLRCTGRVKGYTYTDGRLVSLVEVLDAIIE